MAFRYGRLPRKRSPRVAHYSALVAGQKLPAPPAAIDYTSVLPASLGMFHNDSLGDCTCAAIYHAFQVWSANAQGTIDTEPDDDAMLLYEQACGYVQGQGNTDQGGVEQDVLSYVLLSGAPTGPDGSGRHQIAAFVEIDPRNFDDVKLSIAEGGLVYLGFDVPDYLPSSADNVWDVQPGANYNIVGGHAVIAAGYNADGLTVISWGAKYRMTWAFWSKFVDESYLLADAEWIKASGASPAGMTLAQLEAQMSALRQESQ